MYCEIDKQMEHIKLYEKGTTVYIYEVDNYNEQYLNIMEIVLGEDILKSDDDYVNYNGSLVVSEEEIANAIKDFVKSNCPTVREYSFDIEEK